MGELTVGLALDFGSPGQTFREVANTLQPVVELAEERGFDSIWVGEVYSQSPGAWAAPSSLSVLSWLSARTTSIRLGTGVLLAPAWQPLRLAYEAATVDQLSGGRLVLGIGVGTPALSRWFGNQAPTGQMTDDLLQATRALWAGADSYAVDGVVHEGRLNPLPIQPGGPPVLVGGLAPAAARRAADFDGWYGATNHLLGAHLRPAIKRYRDAVEASEGAAGVVAVNRIAYVAPTAESARREGREYARRLLASYARQNALFGPDGAPMMMESVDLGHMVDELAIIGSKDQVLEKLHAYREAGVTHVQLRVAFGQMPIGSVLRSVELFAETMPPRSTAVDHDKLVEQERVNHDG